MNYEWYQIDHQEFQLYLEETIANTLYWSCHIHNIVSRAHKILGFLRRNLSSLKRESMESCHTIALLTFTFKASNNLVAMHQKYILLPADSHTRSNHSMKYQHFRTHTTIYKYAFFQRVIPI